MPGPGSPGSSRLGSGEGVVLGRPQVGRCPQVCLPVHHAAPVLALAQATSSMRSCRPLCVQAVPMCVGGVLCPHPRSSPPGCGSSSLDRSAVCSKLKAPA